MTTTAQVKALVKPLLKRHSDLTLIGRFLIVSPVHHFARAVLIDRNSDPEQYEPKWTVINTFHLRQSFSITVHEFIANEASRRRGIWKVSEPNMDEVLREQIEQQALPKLRAMTKLEDFLAYVSQHHAREHLYYRPSDRIIVATALGKLENARALRDANIERWLNPPAHFDDEDRQEYERLVALSELLVADDRRGLAELLHSWEAQTVKNLKVEHLWERTPFPLELQ